MKLTPKQAAILRECKNLGGTITRKEAITRFKSWHYANADKYIGELLSGMVDAGFLTRVKTGTYKLAKAGKAATAESNQTELF
jgi:hypothetical protein